MNNTGYKISEREGSMNVYCEPWSDDLLAEIKIIENYCSIPQEFWDATTTSKTFKKYLYKIVRKNNLNLIRVAYSTFKTYIFHTAILLCSNRNKYEYFLIIYIPHFKTIKLNKIHSKLHKLFESYQYTIETFKKNNIFLLQSKCNNFFYCEQELYKICCEIEQIKQQRVHIKENSNKDIKLYYCNRYIGKVNYFYTRSVYNTSDLKSPYKVQIFVIKYGNKNKCIFINEYDLTSKEMNLLKTKEPKHYNENEVY